jgi:alkanesulfonate monooxygenase SsuD/methylene tetrahydromethanopterin reductase-like flavin-dependent oxidoreductase (luciferase family)
VIVDIQFNPGNNDWPVLRDAVLRAEAEGYDTTWVFDHFDGAMLSGDRPVLECFTLLGALAAVTTSIRLGTLVANVANRHPAVLAAAAASVHRISGSRFTLGIGAGAAPGTNFAREHERLGIPLHDNIARRHHAVLDQIDVVRATATLPIIVGVNSAALAAMAGRSADGINVRMSHRRAAEFIEAARLASCEAGHACEISGWAMLSDDTARDRAEAFGLDRLVLVNFGAIA